MAHTLAVGDDLTGKRAADLAQGSVEGGLQLAAQAHSTGPAGEE